MLYQKKLFIITLIKSIFLFLPFLSFADAKENMTLTSHQILKEFPISKISKKFQVPCFAYQVSGEYSMLIAAIKNGWLSEDDVIKESLIGIKRAGATAIFTYFAPKIAKSLKDSTF